MGKVFYWIKLKMEFFRDKRIKKLRNNAGGDTYTIIYLKMLILSLPDEGFLYWDEIEDDFTEELALELEEKTDNVRMTMAYLLDKGLIEKRSEYEYFLVQVPEMLGKETDAASRMRKRREKLEEKRNNVTPNRNIVQKCYTEIDIEKEKELELHTEIDIDSDEIYRGEYGNVKLLDSEYKRLMEKYPDDYRERIDRLSRYIDKTSKYYPSHYATIVRWANEDAARGAIPDSEPKEEGSFDTDSFFGAALERSYAGMQEE